ncbi:MAG TPA: cell division ATP-binding protein FtsE [Candidatus Polarisedimenticolia bacterium]|jgi:cell division transport system ATP-binding protein
MIRLHHATKSYPTGSTALSDVTLHIEKGEFAFLTGPSGAGKTTLLRLLLREELPTSGNVVVNGRNVATMPARDVPYLRRVIGVIFQDFKLIQTRTVIENLTLVQEAVGVPRAEHKTRALKLLRQVSLQHKMNSYPIQLSGGEQQRVAIARALINEPLILLADEPTGNLDPDLSEEIILLLKEINAHGTTVLVATHDRDLLRRFPRRIIHLSAGRVVDPPAAPARAVMT